MKLNRRLGISVASVAVAGLALTGCGTGGGGEDSAAETKSITWMSILHSPTTPEAGGPVESALEELSGYDLKMQWVPAANASEKLTAAIASDTLADIVTVSSLGFTSPTIRQAMKSGQFWDVTDYLDDYPNLAKVLSDQVKTDSSIEGRMYGMPQVKEKARYGILVRQDWLDTLGLEAPHTVEELGEVARAFATQDPDGNGKDDTTGFIDRLESFDLGFRNIAGFFGAGSEFELNDDNEMIASFSTDAFKEGMEWYRSVYEDGAVNNEFVTVQKQNQYDAIAQGKGGIVSTGLFEARGFMQLAESANPDTTMAWALINDMTYGDVERRTLSDTRGGIGGWYVFPKSEVKDEDELKAVLQFINDINSEEAYGIMTNGIEGVHYNVGANGEIETIDEALWAAEVQPYQSSRITQNLVNYPSSSPYVTEAADKMAEQEEFVITNPAQSLQSDTYDTRWSEVVTAAKDAYNKYMVGQIDMAGYEEVIDKLRAGDLGKIEAEYTAAYAESN
ncbi:sugar ABC transporter substrate-binding protein [Microbacterium sorbitolivorans]|uniref:Extracellular solute-binding protein n=1 Tax=Microbacterium sorbitolivorans TaxID=1867410 RepID=A0A367Y8X6_9MICO|nr:extracellular solute-binding protein [Microbacterium sorbitolivorans]RCK62089.1 extracellular solute-binding protein [Microbacterium sorbitolivorans]GGF43306.1 sugar ABC transporter substrate-binding protein [Microbacterium sorbitolivorans]